MAEKLLDMPDGGSVSEHMGRAGMAKGVSGNVLFDPGKPGAFFYYCPDCGRSHSGSPAIEHKIALVFSMNHQGPDHKKISFYQFTNP